MEKVFLVHYGEIALKGGNRAFFEKALARNIRGALKGICSCIVRRMPGRLLVTGFRDSVEKPIRERLRKVCGIVNFSNARKSKQTTAAIAETVWAAAKKKAFKTFKIDARRAGKHISLSSRAVNEEVGEIIRKKSGAKVHLDNPELTCFVEMVEDAAYIYFRKEHGPGGLPVGVSGKVVTLLSGGFDSPVAAYRIMKRGAENVFVHFHSYPQTSYISQEKVRSLITHLLPFQNEARLYLAPFLEIQKHIIMQTPPSLRLILYRRAMIRIAEEIAKKENARALVTGDSLGQVASQTLENIAAVSAATSLPILRPLIGMDKEEIITISRTIGLYDISKVRAEDCCSLFVPEHPETKADLAKIEPIEKALSTPPYMHAALRGIVVERFSL